jgi:chaperonin GroES
MNWRPLGNRVLVKTSRGNTRTPGGIMLPNSAEGKPQRGIVVAVGPGNPRHMAPGVEYWPVQVKEGDEVLFAKHGGIDVGEDLKQLVPELEGHVLLSEQDIVAVLDDGKAKK